MISAEGSAILSSMPQCAASLRITGSSGLFRCLCRCTCLKHSSHILMIMMATNAMQNVMSFA